MPGLFTLLIKNFSCSVIRLFKVFHLPCNLTDQLIKLTDLITAIYKSLSNLQWLLWQTWTLVGIFDFVTNNSLVNFEKHWFSHDRQKQLIKFLFAFWQTTHNSIMCQGLLIMFLTYIYTSFYCDNLSLCGRRNIMKIAITYTKYRNIKLNKIASVVFNDKADRMQDLYSLNTCLQQLGWLNDRCLSLNSTPKLKNIFSYLITV